MYSERKKIFSFHFCSLGCLLSLTFLLITRKSKFNPYKNITITWICNNPPSTPIKKPDWLKTEKLTFALFACGHGSRRTLIVRKSHVETFLLKNKIDLYLMYRTFLKTFEVHWSIFIWQKKYGQQTINKQFLKVIFTAILW